MPRRRLVPVHVEGFCRLARVPTCVDIKCRNGPIPTSTPWRRLLDGVGCISACDSLVDFHTGHGSSASASRACPRANCATTRSASGTTASGLELADGDSDNDEDEDPAWRRGDAIKLRRLAAATRNSGSGFSVVPQRASSGKTF